MTIKTLTENPTITDTIVFDITTPGADGCFTSNPYKVDNLTIYYIARDYQKANFGEYDKVVYDEAILIKAKAAEIIACQDPTERNIAIAKQFNDILESTKSVNPVFYKERSPQKIVGTSLNPAWLSSDVDNALITRVEEDEDGNAIYGHFQYEWSPEGDVREGDFIICWTWTPNPAGESLSAHIPFSLSSDQGLVTVLPAHRTAKDKYETLLELYLPEMYKNTLTDDDLTPEITEKLNLAVAKGFVVLEDLANQLIDLFDANVVHQSLLVYLSNLFGVKLKSHDSTLWRRQIKQAVPLFKKKGTKSGLEEAFAQAGMRLDKITQFWQVISPYTWQESFKVTDGVIFKLEKQIITPIDTDNFRIYLREADSNVYEELDVNYVTFYEENCTSFMTWVGEDLSSGAMALVEGDIIRVLYQYKAVPGSLEQNIEDYIQTLPLADLRDEEDQIYPPKNWNVRLLEEDDIMFDVIIPVRHPFHERLIFGQVRTEFPYSENIYNMETYNGSTRDSYDPCFIDRKFRDPCGSCLSSKFSIDIGIEEISNERLVEVQEIITEYAPFHARMHSMNFSGEISEFVSPPVENIETLIMFSRVEKVISGNYNPIFNRVIEDGLLDAFKIAREDLAEQTTVLSGLSGTAYNEYVHLVSPEIELDDLGVILSNHILEILAPHAHAGTYTIDQIYKNIAVLNSVSFEPIDQTEFTYNLSNINYSSTNATITQANLFEFDDANLNFSTLNVKSIWDTINDGDYSGGAWKLDIPAYGSTYEIENILPDGTLILVDDGSLPSIDVASITYTLLNDIDEEIENSTSGNLTITNRGLINLNDALLINTSQIASIGYYVSYDNVDYVISSFEGNNFYISDYSDGDVVGADLLIQKRLVYNKLGFLGYRGLKMTSASNHESGLGILNGNNASPDENLITDDSNFKENYLIKINGEFYKISFISGTLIILEGKHQDWTTINGEAITYDVLHFNKNGIEIRFNVFDEIDRAGHDILEREIYDVVQGTTAITILQDGGSGPIEHVTQEDNMSFDIKWSNGDVEKGKL